MKPLCIVNSVTPEQRANKYPWPCRKELFPWLSAMSFFDTSVNYCVGCVVHDGITLSLSVPNVYPGGLGYYHFLWGACSL